MNKKIIALIEKPLISFSKKRVFPLLMPALLSLFLLCCGKPDKVEFKEQNIARILFNIEDENLKYEYIERLNYEFEQYLSSEDSRKYVEEFYLKIQHTLPFIHKKIDALDIPQAEKDKMNSDLYMLEMSIKKSMEEDKEIDPKTKTIMAISFIVIMLSIIVPPHIGGWIILIIFGSIFESIEDFFNKRSIARLQNNGYDVWKR